MVSSVGWIKRRVHSDFIFSKCSISLRSIGRAAARFIAIKSSTQYRGQIPFCKTQNFSNDCGCNDSPIRFMDKINGVSLDRSYPLFFWMISCSSRRMAKASFCRILAMSRPCLITAATAIVLSLRGTKTT